MAQRSRRPHIPSLGERLRALRHERGLTLAMVAQASGISTSFLSLVETGKHDISMGRLSRIADFYGVDIRELVPNRQLASVSFLGNSQPHEELISAAEGIKIAFLAPDSARLMIPVVVTLEPRGAWQDESAHHGEEMVYVLKGELLGRVAGSEYALTKDDSLYFDAMLPHSFLNTTGATARLLAVMTGAATHSFGRTTDSASSGDA